MQLKTDPSPAEKTAPTLAAAQSGGFGEDLAVNLGRAHGRLTARPKGAAPGNIDQIVAEHPSETLSVLRRWLHQEQ